MNQEIKVGALARMTGLTVRTLHHYDEIGLLSPAERTATGHRLYGRAEVQRLQRIASLRHLGFSLEEIRDCLDRPRYTLPHVLELHIDRLDRELQEGARLRGLLTSLRERVVAGDGVTLEEVAETIDASLTFFRYYSEEQLDALAERRMDLGQNRIDAAQLEWAELFDAFGAAMNEGLPADDPSVTDLARRASALVDEFTGGDSGIAESLGSMYAAEGGETILAKHGMPLPDGLWAYMSEARRAL